MAPRWARIAVASAFALLALLRCFDIVVPATWEWSMYDIAVRHLLPDPPSNDDVVVVEVGATSLLELDTTWPVPRGTLAEFIDKLSRAKPAVIAMDMLLQKPRQPPLLRPLEDVYENALNAGTPPESPLMRELDALLDYNNEDGKLRRAIGGQSKVILGNIILKPGEEPHVRNGPHTRLDRNFGELETSAAGIGILNANRDWDGLVRRYNYLWELDGETFPSLALAALQNASDRGDELQRRAAALDHGSPLLQFPRHGVTVVEFTDILGSDDRRLRELFHDRIVFVGVTAAGLHDQHPTPVSNVLPGVEIHAFAAMNLLNDTHYLSRDTAAWTGFALTLVIIALVFLATEKTSMSWLLLTALVIFSGHLLIMYLFMITLGWLLAFVPIVGGAVALIFLEVLFRVRELRHERRQVAEQERVNSAKSEFMDTISHELRTPLTSIRGSLGLVAGGAVGKLEPQVAELIKIAHSNTERLIRLVNDFLDFQKISSGKMDFHFKVQPIAPLLRDIVTANHGYAEEFDVTIELADDHEAWVDVDADLLTQAVTNLISNAIKFSPKGDVVRVATELHDERIRIAVSDHGPGIPEEFRGRIFTKFAQSAEAKTTASKGTGLGLSIVKLIVEEHSGQVGFETEVGAGTTFHIDLPLSKPAATSAAEPTSSIDSA